MYTESIMYLLMNLIVVKSYHYLLHTSWILDWIDLRRVSPINVCRKSFVGRVSVDVCQERFVGRGLSEEPL